MTTKRIALACLIVLAAACRPGVSRSGETFVLATTTSTHDSGLLHHLTAEFEREHPALRVKVVAVGSGEALELGRRGDADVLLAHSPTQEETFMEQGLGLSRSPAMSNQFVISGPKPDRADVTSATSAADAFHRVAKSRSEFLSRGDGSGTHAREIGLWEKAGIAPFSEGWYLETGQGMAETLIIASERGSYLLTDTSTLAVMRDKVGLTILFSRDPILVNPYHVIVSAKARHLVAARTFASWIIGSKGQALIGDFGRREFGVPLFTPETG